MPLDQQLNTTPTLPAPQAHGLVLAHDPRGAASSVHIAVRGVHRLQGATSLFRGLEFVMEAVSSAAAATAQAPQLRVVSGEGLANAEVTFEDCLFVPRRGTTTDAW